MSLEWKRHEPRPRLRLAQRVEGERRKAPPQGRLLSFVASYPRQHETSWHAVVVLLSKPYALLVSKRAFPIMLSRSVLHWLGSWYIALLRTPGIHLRHQRDSGHRNLDTLGPFQRLAFDRPNKSELVSRRVPLELVLAFGRPRWASLEREAPHDCDGTANLG